MIVATVFFAALVAFARSDDEEIPPPQPSPETGEMVKVPEEGKLSTVPTNTRKAMPKTQVKISPKAKTKAASETVVPPVKLASPAAPSSFVPVESTGSSPVTAVTATAPVAKAPATPKSQKGIVIAKEATVFQDANFDAAVIATLRGGTVLEMSVGKKDVFYRVRVKPGLTGWISDAEIRPSGAGAAPNVNAKVAAGKKAAKSDSKKASAPVKKRKSKPIQLQRYRGLVFENVNFTEDTMGKVRSSNLTFYGFRWSGNNVVVPGMMYTDAEFLIHSGAPSYYADATGNSAGGLIMMGNFLFAMDVPQTRDLMAYYGFGPMFRFSQFQVDLSDDPDVGKKKSYQLTDISIGAVFGAGFAVALGDRYAVRLDGRYYLEAQRYTSFSLAIQMEW